jgi:hypothetical protein
MKAIAMIVALSCALITCTTLAQTTTVTHETTTTTTTELMKLDSTHVLTVTNFAPGDKITVQTAPATQPIAVKLDRGVTYVEQGGKPISPSSIRPGSHVRLDFLDVNGDRLATRVVLLAAE